MHFRRLTLAEVRHVGCGPWRWIAVLAVVAVIFGAGFCSPALGQEKKPVAMGPKNETKPRLVEDLVLLTSDGVQLTLTYYHGVNQDDAQQGLGKRTIPIVLLHGWKQGRNDFKPLAATLQRLGYAVIVPDLRGHGESTRRKGDVKDEILDAAKMTPSQFGLMVTQDMKAIKDFLWEKNNAGELNIDKLCVVGSQMGASVALNFAGFDAVGYESGNPYYGSRKLGRFVKALILISPKWSSPGLPLFQAIKNSTVQSDISIMIIVGKQDAKAMSESKRIYGMFDRWHPEPTGDNKLDKKTLFLCKLDTSLQGTELFDPKFDAQGLISDFVFRRLVKNDAAREWTWKERKYPTE